MTLDAQEEALDAAALQIIDAVLADVTGAEARATAKRRLIGRIELFIKGAKDIGFPAWLDQDPGGRLTITIEPEAWEPLIPGPNEQEPEL